MYKLDVFIEINGYMELAGTITRTDSSSGQEGSFRYADSYLDNPVSVPISCSLPLRREAFSELQTRIFFEGLLPEGFTRRTVAGWIHADSADYLTILASLGQECIGAIKIQEDGSSFHTDPEAFGYSRLSMEQVHALAREGASKSAELVTKAHLSLAGASGKAGLYYNEPDRSWYLPRGDAPSTHIVKQSHIRLEALVANEQLCLLTAKACGLPTPESFIINFGNAGDHDVLFATRRYDRAFHPACRNSGGLPIPFRLHQEDFAQALAIPASEKYEKAGQHYLPRIFDLLRRRSANPIEDQLRLWDILMFDYLIGNTDNHIKNLSLLYEENLRTVRLAPAYDIVSTCVYESSTRDMAICFGEKCALDDITRADLQEAASMAGIGVKMAMSRFDQLADQFERSLEEAAGWLENEGFFNVRSLQQRILTHGGYHND